MSTNSDSPIPTWFNLASRVALAQNVGELNVQELLQQARTPAKAMDLMLDTAEALVNRPDTLCEALGVPFTHQPHPEESLTLFEAMRDEAQPENFYTERASAVRARTAEFFSLLSRPNGKHYGFLSIAARCDYSQDVRWAFSMGAMLGNAKHARREMSLELTNPHSLLQTRWMASNRAQRTLSAASSRFGSVQELGGKTACQVLGEACHRRVEELLAKLKQNHGDLQAAWENPDVPSYLQAMRSTDGLAL